MSSKREKKRKRKESRELAVKLAKAAAREHIGTPPPTQVKSYRKGGGRKFKENIEKKEEFLNIYEPPPESGVYVSSLRLRPYVATQKKGFRNIMSNVPVIAYSKEMLLHANYLRETKGEKAMNDYLNDQKKETQPNQNIMGPIEAALRDAETKHKYFSGQVAVVQAEANKWQQVAQGLRTALSLATGKTTHTGVNGETKRTQVGKWREWILETLDNPEKNPTSRKELRQKAYQVFPDARPNSTDVAINANLKKILEEGTAFQIEDKIHLAKWTEPGQTESTQQEEKVA